LREYRATEKHYKLEGRKLLLVQPLTLEGVDRGELLLAVDGVDAGEGDRVLVVQEGRSASMVSGGSKARSIAPSSPSSTGWSWDERRSGRVRELVREELAKGRPRGSRSSGCTPSGAPRDPLPTTIRKELVPKRRGPASSSPIGPATRAAATASGSATRAPGGGPVVTRTILHVDMDAFYTSVEERDHPEYRGKPVIVGADPKEGRGRGVVAAASYEARRFGVRSAMPISRAWRACPQGIYLRGNMEKYQEASRHIMDILGSYTDWVEPLSIDEAFLDVSAICLPDRGRALAAEIKENIWKMAELRASIGVAPNKFLAKIASDLEKPTGSWWSPGKSSSSADLPIERLWGSDQDRGAAPSPRIPANLDLWALSTSDPRMASMGLSGYGKAWEHLLLLARGIDDRPGAAPGAEIHRPRNDVRGGYR
jgi:microcompartment protein CcmK/EutM